ncbi:hypothetical protein [Bradyrhizobium sp.]|uniref:hypothetical protein n=1 Tax=Bradyrhizobium sp. TaxID=376 RepID=UPI003C458A21
MSEQAAEQPGGEQGSLNLGISPPAGTSSELAVTASAAETSPAADVPVSEPSMPEPSMSEPAMFEPVASEASKAEANAKASAETSQPEAAKPQRPHLPGKVIVMSRGDRAWADSDIHVEPEMAGHESAFGKRWIAAFAAVVALATVAGAIGGAFATANFMHGGSDVANNGSHSVLEASLSRIDSDIQALKAGLDHTSKLGMNQFNKTSERLDKVERAQAEPSAKIAKLSEAVDKLHALPVPPPAMAAAAAPAASSTAKEVTGSIGSTPAQQIAAASAAPRIDPKDVKTEVGRLPTLDDWVLRDVAYGGALIGGRRGVYEVYAGDFIPGLGRVDAIRRQDGRWVVVTSRGLIVAR